MSPFGVYLFCIVFLAAPVFSIMQSRHGEPGLTRREIVVSFGLTSVTTVSALLIFGAHVQNSQLDQLLVVSMIAVMLGHLRIGKAEFCRNAPGRLDRILAKRK